MVCSTFLTKLTVGIITQSDREMLVMPACWIHRPISCRILFIFFESRSSMRSVVALPLPRPLHCCPPGPHRGLQIDYGVEGG